MDGQEAAFFDDDEPARPLLPPEDRLWRHPSELAMFPPPRRRHRPSISPLVLAPLVVVGVAGVLIVAIVVAGPSTSRSRLRPSEAASVTPLTVSSIVSAVSAVPTVPPAPTTTALRSVTVPATTVPIATTTSTTDPIVTVAANPSGEAVLSNGDVSVPAIDVRDRYVVAAFDSPPDPDTPWTVTDDDGIVRGAHLVGYIAPVRLAVLSVDAENAGSGGNGDPGSGPALPDAPWADDPLWVGASVTIGGHRGELVSMGNEPTADGLAFEHALVADTDSSATASDDDASVGDVVWSDGRIVGLVVHRVDGQVLVIPTKLIKAASASIINGTSELAWLGVSVTGNDRSEITVSAVNPTSPAASIGLHVGDVVASVNGSSISSPADLVAEVWRCGAGHDAQITVTRDGQSVMLEGPLAAMPANA